MGLSLVYEGTLARYMSAEAPQGEDLQPLAVLSLLQEFAASFCAEQHGIDKAFVSQAAVA